MLTCLSNSMCTKAVHMVHYIFIIKSMIPITFWTDQVWERPHLLNVESDRPTLPLVIKVPMHFWLTLLHGIPCMEWHHTHVQLTFRTKFDVKIQKWS